MSTTTHLCTCGEPHVIKGPHKEVLNKMKLNMLKRAATHVMTTMSNDFMVRDIADDDEFKLFNNFSKLRFHGLVTPVRDATNKRIKGRWLITRNGWAFLRGKQHMHAYVLVKDGHIDSYSDDMVTLRGVASQMMELQTRFEYFDENNKPVGLRPAVPITLTQPSLLDNL